MSKNKILFILHVPPPVHGSSMMGGYVKESTIINKAFDATYINLGTSKSIDEIGKKPLSKIVNYLKIILKTLKCLMRQKPDLAYLAITAKGIGFYKDFVVALLIKSFGVPLVLHFHNKGVKDNQDKTIDNILYKIVFKNTHVILLSKHLYSDVQKYVPTANVFYCPNGIPIIDNDEASNIETNNIPSLLFLSNLIASKGVYVLLDALYLLKNKKIKFKCNFVGGEGDVSSAQFNKRINELNIQDSVFYLGKKYEKAKIEIYKNSSVFVFPTFYHNETFGLVNIEAMMFGLPVISTNEGGIPDIVVDNETGFIVKKNNVEQLAEKIEFLLLNPKVAKQMGERGKTRFLNKFTLDKFETNLSDILTRIVHSNKNCHNDLN